MTVRRTGILLASAAVVGGLAGGLSHEERQSYPCRVENARGEEKPMSSYPLGQAAVSFHDVSLGSVVTKTQGTIKRQEGTFTLRVAEMPEDIAVTAAQIRVRITMPDIGQVSLTGACIQESGPVVLLPSSP